MSGDTTTSNFSDFDITDPTGANLFADISRAIGNMSRENRVKRRKEKLRKDLVNEYIAVQQKQKSALVLVIRKLLGLE